MKRLLAMLCALIVLSVPALAHSGRTDGKGGHYNRSTGEYHYHHGYSAHQHPDGVCPYDFDDQTDHSSGGGSVSKPTSTPSPTNLRNSAFDEFFYCNGHPRHRHKDGICPWAEIDAAPKPSYYIREPTPAPFVAGSWVSKTPPPSEAQSDTQSFDEEGLSLLISALSVPLLLLIIWFLSAQLREKNREIKATKAACDAAIHNVNVDCQRRMLAFKEKTTQEHEDEVRKINVAHNALLLDMKAREVAILSELRGHDTPNESTEFLNAVQGFEKPDLSDGVVYISRDLSGRKYHYGWQCTPNGILVSKSLAERVGYERCDCCYYNDQPEHDIVVITSTVGRGLYHERLSNCVVHEKEILLSEALARGLRPCYRCKPPAENPKVWF